VLTTLAILASREGPEESDEDGETADTASKKEGRDYRYARNMLILNNFERKDSTDSRFFSKILCCFASRQQGCVMMHRMMSRHSRTELR